MENSKLTTTQFLKKYDFPNEENIKKLKETGTFEAPETQLFEIVLFLSIALNWLNNIPILKKYGINFRISDILDYHYQFNDFSTIWVITLWENFDYREPYIFHEFNKNIGLNITSEEFWNIISPHLAAYTRIDRGLFEILYSNVARHREFIEHDFTGFKNLMDLSQYLYCFVENFLYPGVDEILENHCRWYEDTNEIKDLYHSKTIEGMCNFIRTSGDNFRCFFITDTDI